VRLPASLSLADGALIEPLAVGLYGVRQSTIRVGSKVLVLGAGTVALCAIWWARILGAAKIVAVSRAMRRAEMALGMGADAFVQSSEDDKAEIAAALGGEPDVVLECVGSPGFLAKGVAHVRKFGEVISMGFCTAPDAINPAATAFKAATLKFPVGYALADFERAARELDAARTDPRMLITSKITLDDLPAAFQRLRGPHQETKVHVAVIS
jgi:(R,R)-butanediol dehydrogenase/meso-butanediol dehydrogenase/diacetyl reductase